MTRENIETRIEDLNRKIKEIEERPTEVYSRIVGYYRSVKNWNNGKSAEYRVRKTFMKPEILPRKSLKQEAAVIDSALYDEAMASEMLEEAAAVESTVAAETVMEEQNNQADLFAHDFTADEVKEVESTRNKTSPGNFLFFFRATCPNCPPMKDYLASRAWKGTHINVDDEEGLNEAVENNVFTAPTVILFSKEGSEIFRTDRVEDLKNYIELEEKTFSAV